MSDPGLLDSNARKVCNIIQDRGIQISSTLLVPLNSLTVYHTKLLSSEELSKLYDAGFRDVDALDSLGRTSFMVAAGEIRDIADISVFEWLVSKGANPMKVVSDVGTVQLHYFAVQMAWVAFVNIWRSSRDGKKHRLSKEAFAYFESHVRFTIRQSGLIIKDQCQCGCCRDGCSPLHLLSKKKTLILIYVAVVDGRHKIWSYDDKEDAFTETQGSDEKYIQYCLGILCNLITRALEIAYEHLEIPDSAYREAIRLFLFLDLGLTHTCCGSNAYPKIGKRKSRDEVFEIQEEER